MIQNKKMSIITIVLLTTIAVLPQYLIRCNLDILYWMYDHFTTYFGDLWYCWNNYLSKGFPYPREYPAGIQVLFRLLYLVPDVLSNYTYYMGIVSAFFLLIAFLISYILLKIGVQIKNILLFWLFAPSFLFYSLLNVDLLPILTMLYAYYCIVYKQKYKTGILSLAFGTTIKVFPIFVLPVYLFYIKPNERVRLFAIFVLSWLLFNLPMMIYDWSAWIFPYIWQIQSNFSRNATDSSWTWLLYVLLDPLGFGSLVGKISLGLFATGYLILLTKFKGFEIETKLLIVTMLFLLTDRVYSPQYNLYFLSALVVYRRPINLIWFYTLEIANICQGIFTFYNKAHVVLLQSFLCMKYLAIIFLLIGVISMQKNENNKLI